MSARRERKVVTVLFADLVGFTSRAESLDPEDVRGDPRPYHEHLRSELERFGGTVEKFIGDAVMALFGAPVAHEDDPERAVRAALAIREWAEEEGELEVRVGITTGEVVVIARCSAGAGREWLRETSSTRLRAYRPPPPRTASSSTRRPIEPRSRDRVREAPSGRREGQGEPVLVWRPSRRGRGSGPTSQEPRRRSSAASGS